MSNVAGNLANGVALIHMRNLPGRRWVKQAACLGHDPDLWFLDDQTGSYREARAICNDCPVRIECLDWAIDSHTEHGLWGGLNPTERKQLRRRQHLQFSDSDHQRVDDVRPRTMFL